MGLTGSKILRAFAALLLAGACLATRAATKDESDAFFGLTNVHTIHLKVTKADWASMQPEPSAGNRGPGPGGPMSQNFKTVPASFECDGKALDKVGLRFKGNSSFRAGQQSGKTSFKVDFNEFVKGQKFRGLGKLNLNNNAMDPSEARESLAYSIVRETGAPASRTAFARVYLTVSGEREHELIGLYTIVEQVDSRFLKAHFDEGGGLLLKPERMGDLPYLGDDWNSYKDRLEPKDEASPEQARRYIALTKLIHQSDDAAFKKEIVEAMDVPGFLKFIALNDALANLDSFIGSGHNYYLYLNPKDRRFHFIAWDLNEAFGRFPMAGSADDQMKLSIRHPAMGRNRLIERLVAIPEFEKMFLDDYRELLRGPMKIETVKATLRQIQSATASAMKEEPRQAMRGGPGPGGRGPQMAPPLEEFIEGRVASIQAQLDGKSEGKILERGNGPGGRGPGGPGGPGGPAGGGGPGGRGFGPNRGGELARRLLQTGDANHDGHLSESEMTAAASAWFKKFDANHDGQLDLNEILDAIPETIPPPPGLMP